VNVVGVGTEVIVNVPLYPDGVMLATVTDWPTASPCPAEVVIVATLLAQVALVTVLAVNVAAVTAVVRSMIPPVPVLTIDRLPLVVVIGPAIVRPVPLWVMLKACPATTTPAGAMASAPSPRFKVTPVTPEAGTVTLLVPLPVAPPIDVVIVSPVSVTTRFPPESATDRLLFTPPPAVKVRTLFVRSRPAGTSRGSSVSIRRVRGR
jgi:hypothetical protein